MSARFLKKSSPTRHIGALCDRFLEGASKEREREKHIEDLKDGREKHGE